MFITRTNLVLENLSNHFTAGTATVKLAGRFMDSGDTSVAGAFRSELNGPNFDLNAEMVDADLRAMNDVLRAHGKFDVVSGVFSLYSEVRAKDRWIRAWVKPREGVRAGGRGRRQGPQEPSTQGGGDDGRHLGSTRQSEGQHVQVLGRLIENAFFRAILPLVPAGRREEPGLIRPCTL